MMLLFTKTRINLSLNWSKVKSQDHSVQFMVQVFWIVCWGHKTSGYSLAYKATEKRHFLNNISRNLWSKSNFLAEYLPQSSQILFSPSEAFQKCIAWAGAQSYLLQEQAAVRTPTHILFGLVFCSGTALGQVEAGQTPSYSPFQGYETSLWNTVLCVCRRSDCTAGKGCSIRPFPATRGTQPSWKGWRASPPS